MARPTSVSTLSTAELHREVARRQRLMRTLSLRRAALMKRVASLDARLIAIGGPSRTRNKKSLVETLSEILSGKIMSPVEAAEAAKAAGHRTNASAFRTIVTIALSKGGKFRRVARGRYTAR